MKKHYLWLFAVFLFLSCGQKKASNSSNVLTNTAANQPANNSNTVLPTANQNQTSQANSAESLELMKQIENQQRETSKQTTTSNKNGAVKTPQPPKPGTSQRQTF